MKHILMTNNITQKDNLKVANFLKTNPILTNNKKVREFEKQWSKWLGTKYSVFVNSGSSANLLSISYLRTLYKDGEIIEMDRKNSRAKIKGLNIVKKHVKTTTLAPEFLK